MWTGPHWGPVYAHSIFQFIGIWYYCSWRHVEACLPLRHHSHGVCTLYACLPPGQGKSYRDFHVCRLAGPGRSRWLQGTTQEWVPHFCKWYRCSSQQCRKQAMNASRSWYETVASKCAHYCCSRKEEFRLTSHAHRNHIRTGPTSSLSVTRRQFPPRRHCSIGHWRIWTMLQLELPQQHSSHTKIIRTCEEDMNYIEYQHWYLHWVYLLEFVIGFYKKKQDVRTKHVLLFLRVHTA